MTRSSQGRGAYLTRGRSDSGRGGERGRRARFDRGKAPGNHQSPAPDPAGLSTKSGPI